MIDAEVDWTSQIKVTEHARQRARERLGWAGSATDISADVRDALLHDRYGSSRPNWTRGNQRDGDREEVFFVWDREATRCWVVARLAPRTMLVKTLLPTNEQYQRTGDQQRIRSGMRRAS